MSSEQSQRIFIVDDEAPARARLRDLLADIQAEFPNEIAGEAADGVQALTLIEDSTARIALLDVQMPGMTGIELARHLNKLAAPPAVVFVTAYDEFAVQAFEVHALDYLMKPVRAPRLLDALRHAVEMTRPAGIEDAARLHAANRGGRSFLSVQERGRVLLVPVGEVVYFKAEMKYVTIRTADREFLTEESLVALEDEFADRFIRVHRNALIARSAVAGFERVETVQDGESVGEPHWEVVLRGVTERLPVSRRQWPAVKALLKS